MTHWFGQKGTKTIQPVPVPRMQKNRPQGGGFLYPVRPPGFVPLLLPASILLTSENNLSAGYGTGK
jgi:hypothetical protein